MHRALLLILSFVALTGCATHPGKVGAVVGAADRADVFARTEAGAVRGMQGAGVRAFLGVPYAAPPVGALRWRAPRPVEPWTGVRNATAARNLREMALGDRAFFYHSNIGKEIVGVVEVARTAYPDPTDETGRWVCVDVKAVAPVPRKVGLAAVKADARLAELALVRQSRLSVMPVGAEHWAILCDMAGWKDEASRAA